MRQKYRRGAGGATNIIVHRIRHSNLASTCKEAPSRLLFARRRSVRHCSIGAWAPQPRGLQGTRPRLTILVYLHTRSPLGRRGRTRETPRARVRRPPAPRGPVESSRAALAGFGRGGQPAPAPPLPPGRGRHTSYNGRELSFNKNRFTEHATSHNSLTTRTPALPCSRARAATGRPRGSA
jgi:hypothetical protein